MAQRMQHQSRSFHHPVELPHGYAIAQLADHRFYPLSVERFPDGESYHLSHLRWQYRVIPFAVGPRSTHGVISFTTLALAVDCCHRYADEWELLWTLGKTTRMAPLYPERAAWYDEAINEVLVEHHASLSPYSEAVMLYASSDEVRATLYYWQGIHIHHITVTVPTIDDARPALYEALASHFYQQELELACSTE